MEGLLLTIKLGEIYIGSLIGKGGGGKVYKGRYKEKLIALKTLLEQELAEE